MKFCEGGYVIERIRARHEVCDFVFLEDLITVTQRLTFPSSAPCKCLGKEGDDNPAGTYQLMQRVSVAVRPLQAEIRGRVTYFWCGKGKAGECKEEPSQKLKTHCSNL